jgi:MFS family permease
MPHPYASLCLRCGKQMGMPSPAVRRARSANTLVFFITGAVYAAWATRIPSIQGRLDLSAGELGLAILGLEAGAIVGLPAGGALVARLGSRTGVKVGFAFYPTALVGVAFATALPVLAIALAAMAAATSVVDVAMNAQGVELERRYRRPVLSSMHAGHPLGLVAGGLAGTAAAATGVPVQAHLTAAAAVGLVVGLAAARPLVGERSTPGGRAFAKPSGRLLLLGLIAFCAFLLDGAAYNWSAVHLRSDHGAGGGLAAAAFTAFALALAAGRLTGDSLVARFGPVHVVRAGGLVAAAGSALAVVAPGAGAGIAGWVLVGLGLAAVAPIALGAAPRADDSPPAVAIASVTTIGYLGSFTGPSLVGGVAELTSVSAGLGLLVLVSLVMAALASGVAPGRPAART